MRMGRYALILTAFSVLTSLLFAADEGGLDPAQLFFRANTLYEKGDYQKAAESYLAIVDKGLESGNLYYNLGNSFLKLGKVGYAILCYEKAKNFIPQDSDLKANRDYARSLADIVPEEGRQTLMRKIWEVPFKDFNINALAILGVVFYIIVILLAAAVLADPLWARRLKAVLIITLFVFVYILSAFAVRYRDEKLFEYGIVLQKEAEARYEPIEKSTTYYTLKEGNEIRILRTRNGWRQVMRPDGKIAWVEKDAIGEI